MSTIPNRGPYQGVLQILQFNWRFYVATTACIGLALTASAFLQPVVRIGVLLCVAPALFWLGSSLLVSHYVYDRFPLYDLTWISRALSRSPRRWINIHCGLDETSVVLTAVFPNAAGEVVNIFDPRIMTETSINEVQRGNEAQGSRGAVRAMQARYDDLTFQAELFDAAFAIFAAHELRRHDQRVKLFEEIERVLVAGGELLVMEHSRDWRNFMAFGPGFLHFFSQRAWRTTAADAGFALRREFAMTPFVHVYILRKNL